MRICKKEITKGSGRTINQDKNEIMESRDLNRQKGIITGQKTKNELYEKNKVDTNTIQIWQHRSSLPSLHPQPLSPSYGSARNLTTRFAILSLLSFFAVLSLFTRPHPFPVCCRLCRAARASWALPVGAT